MNKYLVIHRNEDEPMMDIVPEAHFTKFLDDYGLTDYNRLSELPNLMEFPANSVFIMRGNVLT